MCSIGELGIWTLLLVHGSARDGHSEATGIVLAQRIPTALLTPLAGALTDRLAPLRRRRAAGGRDRVDGGDARLFQPGRGRVRLGGPRRARLGPHAAGTGGAVARPMGTPGELSPTNVLAGWSDSAASLAGPALAGGAVALGGIGAAMAVMALANALGAALVVGLGERALPDQGAMDHGPLGGLRATVAAPATRVLLVANGFSHVLVGALDVISVVLVVRLFHSTAQPPAT